MVLQIKVLFIYLERCLGYSQLCSRLTYGRELRDYFLWAWRTMSDAGDKTQVSHVQDKSPMQDNIALASQDFIYNVYILFNF